MLKNEIERFGNRAKNPKEDINEFVNPEKPFTFFEYKYMEDLHNVYNMNLDVSREIILYGKAVNHGLMIKWFLDAVSNYVSKHNGKTVESTQDLLKSFHTKFVVDFGKK